MRKPVLLIFTNACILIAIFALLTRSLFVVQRVAQVGKVNGRVDVQRGGNGAPVPLAEGMTVQTADLVTTGSNSSVELSWLDGTRWKLLSNSEAVLRQASFSSDGKFELSRLQLTQGKLLVRVARALARESGFEVETPTALARTLGQVFSVQVRSGYTAVDVFRGSVDIKPLYGGQDLVAIPNKRVVESSKGWVTFPVKANDQFCNDADFTKPHLKAKVKPLGSDYVQINGETEVGSRVLINGKSIPVLGTGVFVRRVKRVSGATSWKIESVDRYGQRSEVTPELETA